MKWKVPKRRRREEGEEISKNCYYTIIISKLLLLFFLRAQQDYDCIYNSLVSNFTMKNKKKKNIFGKN